MNKYRNSSNTRLLKALFFEMVADKTHVIYTLKDEAHEGYPSLYQAYMACEDPTEWEFANKYMDGWEHWQMLCRCSWFKPFIERWREELDVMLAARRLRHIEKEAEGEGKNAFQANKYLLEKGYAKEKGAKKRGRPSKEQVQQEARRQAEENKQIEEDFKRLKDKKEGTTNESTTLH